MKRENGASVKEGPKEGKVTGVRESAESGKKVQKETEED